MGARPSPFTNAGDGVQPSPVAVSSEQPARPAAASPGEALRRLGLHARKRFSQSFLADVSVCEAMADAAELSASDEVLEIGPGLGILTFVLTRRAGRVVAVELDRDLAAALPGLVPAPNLEVVPGDALAFDPSERFPGPYKLLGNLPYSISTALLSRYLLEVRRPCCLVAMLQREVAERMVASDGRSSYLSILVAAYGRARVIRRVPPGAFVPPPKVTSAVVALDLSNPPALEPPAMADFLALVRAGYTQPRKTLLNSLAQGLQRSKAEVAERLASAGVDPATRPERLCLDDWLRLHRAAPWG